MNIIDQNSLLTSGQVSLLQSCSILPFQLKDYHSLDDILTKQNVDVIIESGIVTRHVPDNLLQAQYYWREEVKRLGRLVKEGHEESLDELREAKEKHGNLMAEVSLWRHMRLRGLYDPDRNAIILYPEAMAKEHKGSRIDELLVSTLAHETMHAYFNRPRHRNYPYVPLVEEPLSEFGMLLYLRETGSQYYQWAYKDVSNKRTYYRYGAKLMDRCLTEGKLSATRSYMEAYKIQLNPLMVPEQSSDGAIDLPAKSGNYSSVNVNGNMVNPGWKDVFKDPPRHFYDATTKTLGLDGCWDFDSIRPKHNPYIYDIPWPVNMYINENEVDNVYLGDHFYSGERLDFFPRVPITVSPNNKYFYSINGIPFIKETNKPVLLPLGKGFYKLHRNGKCGAVDDKANQVVPCKYGNIGRPDKNDLMKVRNNDLRQRRYGLVNLQGKEQVPLIYDDIKENQDGTYEVKQGGKEFDIDKDGKTI